MTDYNKILEDNKGLIKFYNNGTLLFSNLTRKNANYFKYLTSEDILHILVVCYLESVYPDVIFNHSPLEGKRTPYERFKMKYMGAKKGWPDIFIAEQYSGKPVLVEAETNVYEQEMYFGLFLELKVLENSPYYKNTKTLKKDQHLASQAEKHILLRNRGYWANFVIGFDKAKEVIDWYLK